MRRRNLPGLRNIKRAWGTFCTALLLLATGIGPLAESLPAAGLEQAAVQTQPTSDSPLLGGLETAADGQDQTETPAAGTDTLPVQIGAEDAMEEDLIRYEEVFSNQYLTMFADMKKGLFAIRQNTDGYIWYSTPNDVLQDTSTKGKARNEMRSQLTAEVLFRSDDNTLNTASTINSQVECVLSAGVDVEKIPGGIRVVYLFSEKKFRIPVEYVIEEDHFIARVDVANIDEGDECYLLNIDLLPTFGAGNRKTDGYMLIPDGCGAVVNFNNNVQPLEPYEALVYGEELAQPALQAQPNRETVRMPVFGLVREEHALMGIITEGDGAASITALTGSDTCGYNTVSSRVNLRMLTTIESFYSKGGVSTLSRTTQTRFGSDCYEVEYHFLTGEEASYTGMAEHYRRYLVEEKGLTKRLGTPAMNLNVYGAADTQAFFLGIPYTKKEKLTTFAQAVEMLEGLREKGIDRFAVRYIGWQNNGIRNAKIPGKAAPLRALGGKAGFEELEAYLAENGDSLYPEADLLTFTKSGNGVRYNRDAIKTSADIVALQHEFLPSVFTTRVGEQPYTFLSPTRLGTVIDAYLPSHRELTDAIGLGTITKHLYSSFSTKDGLFRSEAAGLFEAALRKASESGLSMAGESANAYALPYIDRVFSAPVYSSGHDIFDYDVPFYQMVLHGYVNTTVEPARQSFSSEINFLKAVETGSELLYSAMAAPASVLTGTSFSGLYSSTWTLWAEEAADRYRMYMPLLSRIYDREIVGHERPAEQVTCTLFEGGIRVYVNYGDEAVTVDGVTVPGHELCGREG